MTGVGRTRILAAFGVAAASALVLFVALGWSERGQPPAAPDSGAPTEREPEAEGLVEGAVDARAPAATPGMLVADEEEPLVEQPRRGRLLVRLVTADGEEVTKGRVAATGAGIAEALVVEVTDQRPVAEFENVGPGEVYLVVELDSLPEGYFPPREQMRRKRWPQPGALVEVAAGETVERALVAERGAYVHGRVWDEDPRPIEGAYVRFSSSNSAEDGFGRMAIEIEAGTYGLFLPSGRWAAMVEPGSFRARPRDAPPLRPRFPQDRPRPLPVALELDPGSSTRLDFDWTPGACGLRLVARDHHGRPFEELKVAVFPRSLREPSGHEVELNVLFSVAGGRTDRAGVFECRGLEAGSYVAQFETGPYLPLAAPGESKVGQVARSFPVEASTDVPETEIVLIRVCPIRVSGSVLTKDERARRGVRLELVLAGRWRTKASRYALSLDGKGAFSFYLEAQERDARLELDLGDDFLVVPLDLPADPHPGALAPQGTIVFPQ